MITTVQSASKKIGSLIRPRKFPFPEVVLYLYKSIKWSCMKYCSMSGLVLLAAT